MKRCLLLSIIIFFYIPNLSYSQPVEYPSGKGHIVAGCLINALGIALIVQSANIRKGPSGYPMTFEEKRSRQGKANGVAILGGVCLVVGTLNIAKGIKMNNRRRWGATLTGNGLGFTYRI